MLPLLGRRVMLRDLLRSNLNGAVLLDDGRDLFISFPAFSERLNFVADHADKGFKRKLFRLKPGGVAESGLLLLTLLPRGKFCADS